MYWLNLNAGYDGDIFLTVILNGAIHTVMYTYYFLSMHTKVRTVCVVVVGRGYRRGIGLGARARLVQAEEAGL